MSSLSCAYNATASIAPLHFPPHSPWCTSVIIFFRCAVQGAVMVRHLMYQLQPSNFQAYELSRNILEDIRDFVSDRFQPISRTLKGVASQRVALMLLYRIQNPTASPVEVEDFVYRKLQVLFGYQSFAEVRASRQCDRALCPSPLKECPCPNLFVCCRNPASDLNIFSTCVWCELVYGGTSGGGKAQGLARGPRNQHQA